jgi:opacity protein-like surface antigen
MQWNAGFPLRLKCFTSIVMLLVSITQTHAEGQGRTFQGSYVGFAVGPAIITGNFGTGLSVDYLDTASSRNDMGTFAYSHPADDASINGVGRVTMGYGGCLFVNCFYLGLELSAFKMLDDTVTDENTDNQVFFTGSIDESELFIDNKATATVGGALSLDLKTGFLLSEEFLLYALIGVVGTEVELTSTVAVESTGFIEAQVDQSETTENQFGNGWHLGLGVEQKIGSRMGLIFAYTYTFYDRIEVEQSGTTFSTTNTGVQGEFHSKSFVTITQQEAWLGLNYYF